MKLFAGLFVLAAFPALASETGGVTVGAHVGLGTGLLLGSIYALVGTLLLIVCFKIFDKVLTRIDLEGEVLKGNVAVGILSAAVLLAIAHIIAAAISG